MLASACAESGPISKIMSSSLTSDTAFKVALADSENSVPTTTSVGTGISPLLAFASVVKRVASATKSCSYNDLPTLWPSAAIKVLAIPPPTTSWSTTLASESNTVNLVDTFEPPTIATNGRAGLSSAFESASNSPANSGPAHATGANLATP